LEEQAAATATTHDGSQSGQSDGCEFEGQQQRSAREATVTVRYGTVACLAHRHPSPVADPQVRIHPPWSPCSPGSPFRRTVSRGTFEGKLPVSCDSDGASGGWQGMGGVQQLNSFTRRVDADGTSSRSNCVSPLPSSTNLVWRSPTFPTSAAHWCASPHTRHTSALHCEHHSLCFIVAAPP
jgi:hypothetical protein